MTTQYQAPFVTVRMPDGTEVKVKRFSALARPGLSDFKGMYQNLVKIFVDSNAMMGDILANEEGIKILSDMAAILPIQGEERPGLDLATLLDEGDIEQVCSLFVTASMQKDGKNRGEYKKDPKGEQLPYEPGEIAKLNQLDFFGYVGQALRDDREMTEAVQKALALEALETAKNESSEKSPVVEILK